MTHKTYVAGFTDSEVETREDLFDILVNGRHRCSVHCMFMMVTVPAGVVTIAHHATDDFALGKQHKQIAMAMMEAAQDEDSSDADVVKVCSIFNVSSRAHDATVVDAENVRAYRWT